MVEQDLRSDQTLPTHYNEAAGALKTVGASEMAIRLRVYGMNLLVS